MLSHTGGSVEAALIAYRPLSATPAQLTQSNLGKHDADASSGKTPGRSRKTVAIRAGGGGGGAGAVTGLAEWIILS